MKTLARLLAITCLCTGLTAMSRPPAPAPMPRMSAEADWLKLPEGKVLGEVTAVAVDAKDHVWVLHRPGTVAAADRQRAAPAVMEFDSSGRYVSGFGGPGKGYEWPRTEHSLEVDDRGHVWVAGNYRGEQHGDDMVLEFTRDGAFVRQIGKRGASKGDADIANVQAPGDIFVDDRARELYVADGYKNHRVIVFDLVSAAFKRMWGGFGAPPAPPPAPQPPHAPYEPRVGDGPAGFDGVHGVEVSNDGLVYVSDRNHLRVQVFTREGKYLRQAFVGAETKVRQTAAGIAFSPDRAQRYMYVVDFGNARLLVYERASLKLLGQYGGPGSDPGQFKGAHLIATDSKGTLYVAELQGRRLQRITVSIPRR